MLPEEEDSQKGGTQAGGHGPSPGGWGGFLLSLGLARVERSLDAG